jgi:hypothetical protein
MPAVNSRYPVSSIPAAIAADEAADRSTRYNSPAPRNDQRESRVAECHGDSNTAGPNDNTVSDINQFVTEKNT